VWLQAFCLSLLGWLVALCLLYVSKALIKIYSCSPLAVVVGVFRLLFVHDMFEGVLLVFVVKLVCGVTMDMHVFDGLCRF